MSRYTDIPSSMQVLACLYRTPELLENERYFFLLDDFTETFHRLLFTSINNLYEMGVHQISAVDIRQYLEGRPKQLAIYETNKGDEYLQRLYEDAQVSAFEYYYNRVKKFSLLRAYNEGLGMDLKFLYDIDNILDIKKKQKQEEWLDNTPLNVIAEIVERKIEDIKCKYVNNADSEFEQAGEGALALVQHYKETPEMGYPLFGAYWNTIFRGARLGKLFLRSGSTGLGKTRSMVADACNFGCNERYDKGIKKWIANGTKEPTLYIATEQELSEMQTMMIAFIADVDEEHILNGRYDEGEWDRVEKAALILEESPIYIKYMPDFTMREIESAIKMSIREYGVKYICYDYLHSSMGILGEISRGAGVKGLREDNVLFMLAVKLKDICNQYGVFIETGTQLNGNYQDADVYDQNLLRGSKAIADKVDAGMIMIPVTAEDREKILPLCQKLGCELPTVKTSVYKNRRGRWKDILVWCKDNRATCKIEPMFVTDYRLELIQIEDYKITVIPKEDKEVVKASTQLKPKLQEKKEEITNNKLFDF